jgi:hypothetical protein
VEKKRRRFARTKILMVEVQRMGSVGIIAAQVTVEERGYIHQSAENTTLAVDGIV